MRISQLVLDFADIGFAMRLQTHVTKKQPESLIFSRESISFDAILNRI